MSRWFGATSVVPTSVATLVVLPSIFFNFPTVPPPAKSQSDEAPVSRDLLSMPLSLSLSVVIATLQSKPRSEMVMLVALALAAAEERSKVAAATAGNIFIVIPVVSDNRRTQALQ